MPDLPKVDYYALLGVSSDAPQQEIREAYRLKVRLVHPDRHQGQPVDVKEEARRATAELNEAWSVLGDPQRRAAYDAGQGAAQTEELYQEVADEVRTFVAGFATHVETRTGQPLPDDAWDVLGGQVQHVTVEAYRLQEGVLNHSRLSRVHLVNLLACEAIASTIRSALEAAVDSAMVDDLLDGTILTTLWAAFEYFADRLDDDASALSSVPLSKEAMEEQLRRDFQYNARPSVVSRAPTNPFVYASKTSSSSHRSSTRSWSLRWTVLIVMIVAILLMWGLFFATMARYLA